MHFHDSTWISPITNSRSTSRSSRGFGGVALQRSCHQGTAAPLRRCTMDFPNNPPVAFDYTNASNALNGALVFAPKKTSVKKVKYNTTIEIILQNTSFITVENHPMHVHGFNFHVLAQGFGNFDPAVDRRKFSMVNPQVSNTIGVSVGGWVAIRFTANNPGVRLVHCHLDMYLRWGLAMAFVVENGPTPSTTLPPPPLDLPLRRCKKV